MCLFTREVIDVSDTKIFARAAEGPKPRQLLVYEMMYSAVDDLAMVLPLPVPAGSPEEAVRFISLEHCKRFFRDLDRGFPDDREMGSGIEHLSLGDVVDMPVRILEVHEVGAYEASFVPTPADFGRLDERFRLPVDIWLELNAYRDYGFAVFKLKPTSRAKAHAMAFEFPTRHPERLFFPTLHMHDKQLGRNAAFDHMLYCQPTHEMQFFMKDWEYTEKAVAAYMACEEARPLFDLELPCWRQRMTGVFENADCWIGKGGRLPERLA